MGMRASRLVTRQRRVSRSRTPRRVVRVRARRGATAGSARAPLQRPRQRRAAEARRGAGRRPPRLGSERRRLPRSGLVVDPERRLGTELGVDGGAGSLMRGLPSTARLYVAAVILAGVALFAVCLPHAQFQQPLLFVALLALSSASTALKVHLPLTAGKSTMSISYAVDFASLLLLGPHETMLVTAGSALSQCHLNRQAQNPLHRTLFSVASLVLTVQAAGLAFHLLGGTGASLSFVTLARPLV